MESASLRFVIIGGVAAGASAAARARRLSESAEITLIERGPDVSFANCGMPYFIGEEIKERSKLAIQTPESLTQLLNITIHTHTEAVKIHRERKVVIVRNVANGQEREIPYDKLLLAPGARPMRPALPGIDDPRIMTLRNLQDMDNIKARVTTARKVLVIGAGFIGLEMVEMLVKLGKEVALVELQNQVLPQMDAEMTKHIQAEIVAKGVELILGDGIAGFDNQPAAISARLNSGKTVTGDVVILSIGVQCESDLAAQTGLELGQRRAIKVNEWQQTSDPNIYAAGDAVETADPILGKRVVVPLGGPANRQGRVVADHIFLGDKALPYPGTLGTAIVRVFDVAAGVTGYTEKRLAAEKIPYRATTVTYFQHASYYPGAVPLLVKILWSSETGKLLGGQVTGCDGVDKRLDVLSTALQGKMTIDDLCQVELSYAPPFGSARDVINLAAFSAQNIQRGLVEPTYMLPESDDVQLVDVRPPEQVQVSPIPNAIAIPLAKLRQQLPKLDKNKPTITACAVGKTSYFASRILKQHGFAVSSFVGGWNLKSLNPMTVKPTFKACGTDNACKGSAGGTKLMENLAPIEVDACGLSCPGPIMKIKESIAKLSPGQKLIVKASDPGFEKDFPAYCQATGLEFLSLEKSKGILTASARKLGEAALATTTEAKAGNGATIVVFSCDLDKVLASFVIANGAAAMGGRVTMFFTFWGLNALRKEGKVKVSGKTFMDKMFGWMMPKGLGALPLSRMHMAGMGTWMMKGRMKAKNLPNLPGLVAQAKQAGIRLVACSMSMEAMGLKQEELLDGVEIGGVADFLAASGKTATNLFI